MTGAGWSFLYSEINRGPSSSPIVFDPLTRILPASLAGTSASFLSEQPGPTKENKSAAHSPAVIRGPTESDRPLRWFFIVAFIYCEWFRGLFKSSRFFLLPEP